MADRLRLSSLIPAGLIVERTAEVEGVLVVSAQATADERACVRFAGEHRDVSIAGICGQSLTCRVRAEGSNFT